MDSAKRTYSTLRGGVNKKIEIEMITGTALQVMSAVKRWISEERQFAVTPPTDERSYWEAASPLKES